MTGLLTKPPWPAQRLQPGRGALPPTLLQVLGLRGLPAAPLTGASDTVPDEEKAALLALKNGGGECREGGGDGACEA